MIGGRLFLGLIALLACERLFELWLSRAHARAAFRAGAHEIGRRHYRAMALFHAAFLGSCVLELIRFRPSAPAAVEDLALVVALAAQGLRYWAVAALGPRWNTRILVWPDAPPVRRGPYRWLRHPNYLAVILELAAVPMVHGCFRTAIVFSLGNALLLAIRIPAEEHALGDSYRTAFASTPRLLPGGVPPSSPTPRRHGSLHG